MSTLLHILTMLSLVAATGFAGQRWRRMPLPLLQICIGAAVAWPASGLHVLLEPEVFMGLFLPPLLFASAQQMPQREMNLLKAPILLLAVGLVATTVLAVGVAAHALLPFLSWPLCFLLAALLSPTDAVAFGALVAGRSLPARMLRILEGESLVNDASGLTAVKLCLAALGTGFSPWHALSQFLVVAAGGIAIGLACSWALQELQQRLTAGRGPESSLPGVLLQLLAPFLPYLLAEHFGASGVLAVVAAGLFASARHARMHELSVTRMHAQSTTRLLTHVLDGAVFLLLGMQLPALVRTPPAPAGVAQASGMHDLRLYLSAALVAFALLAVRFAWIAALGCVARRRTRTGEHPRAPIRSEALKLSAVGALAGVRGAISLAAALGLPYLLPDGTPLPARDLMLFLCAGAIVTSLFAPAVLLPALLRRGRSEREPRAPLEERWARRRTLRAALASLDQSCDWRPVRGSETLHRVREEYLERLRASDAPPGAVALTCQPPLAQELRLRLHALTAERQELVRLRLSHRINDVTFQSLSARVDFDEVYFRRQ
jgi:CPA1 family monovalent cation:H+ antiporter